MGKPYSFLVSSAQTPCDSMGRGYNHPSHDLATPGKGTRVANQPRCKHGTWVSQRTYIQSMTMMLGGKVTSPLGITRCDSNMSQEQSCGEHHPETAVNSEEGNREQRKGYWCVPDQASHARNSGGTRGGVCLSVCLHFQGPDPATQPGPDYRTSWWGLFPFQDDKNDAWGAAHDLRMWGAGNWKMTRLQNGIEIQTPPASLGRPTRRLPGPGSFTQ